MSRIDITDDTYTVDKVGEVKLIELIQEWLGDATPPPPEGIGDDCAVLTVNEPSNLVVTADALTYQVHFDDDISPTSAGSKLIKRNLSDLAAMGATPTSAVLALLCGPDISVEWLKQFFAGIRDTCSAHQIKIIGGDISGLPPGQLSTVLTLTGIAKTPMLRTGGSINDWLYVTGTLGGSILSKHTNFTPRLREGVWLASNHDCVAMMDLTDGLAKDLRCLLPPNANAALEIDKIPLSTDTETLSKTSGKSCIQHAFCDGEDYELICVIKADTDLVEFEAKWHKQFPTLELSRIGQIVEDRGKGPYIDSLTGETLPWIQGFEHLKRT